MTSISKLEGGKRVGGFAYFHFSHPSAILFLEENTPNWLGWSRYELKENVLKVPTRESIDTYSLLYYGDFYEAPFPELQWSIKVSLVDKSAKRREEKSNNPPILHRKELLLSSNDPSMNRFLPLTQALLENKLLPTSNFIGRKIQWDDYLRCRGFTVRNHSLIVL